MSDEIDLFGSGNPTVSFKKGVGTKVSGVIVGQKSVHQRKWYPDNKVGGLMYWNEGRPEENAKTDADGEPNKPFMALCISVDTGAVDSTIPNDDGVRDVYHGTKHARSAVQTAARNSGAGSMDGMIGYWYEMERVADIPGKGASPAWGYRCVITKDVPKDFSSKVAEEVDDFDI